MSGRLRSTLTVAIGAVIVLAVWLAAVAVLTFFTPPPQPVAVVARGGLGDALAAVVAADGAILQVRGNTVIAISDAPGFVPRLYRNGALFVVLSRPGGCIVAPSVAPPIPPARASGERA